MNTTSSPSIQTIQTPTLTTLTNNNSTIMSTQTPTPPFILNEEKIYKKEKQILLEFDLKTKGNHNFTSIEVKIIYYLFMYVFHFHF